jgi:xylulokinase
MGGGSKSRLWSQIKSDCVGKPIVTVASEEAASLGVAINAAVELGLFPSLEKACENMVHIREQFCPDKEKEHIYSEGYERYLKLYEALYEYGLFM